MLGPSWTSSCREDKLNILSALNVLNCPIMATPPGLLKAVGKWQGQSNLNLPEDGITETVFSSTSTLSVETDSRTAYSTVSYTWEFDGTTQMGCILICGSGSQDSVTCGWTDSWHQNGSVMPLAGRGMLDDAVSLTGSYGDGSDGPDWGWRIELSATHDAFKLTMTNITPEGEEMWAVKAEYIRA